METCIQNMNFFSSEVEILLNEGGKIAQLCVSIFRAALFCAFSPEEINNGWLTSLIHHSEMRKPKCISLGQACFPSRAAKPVIE